MTKRYTIIYWDNIHFNTLTLKCHLQSMKLPLTIRFPSLIGYYITALYFVTDIIPLHDTLMPTQINYLIINGKVLHPILSRVQIIENFVTSLSPSSRRYLYAENIAEVNNNGCPSGIYNFLSIYSRIWGLYSVMKWIVHQRSSISRAYTWCARACAALIVPPQIHVRD